MDTHRPNSFLDGMGGRLMALAVLAGALASLAVIHWEDLFPPDEVQRAADDPVAICLAARASDIDKMVEEGVVTETQAATFKQRAEALCQAQVGGGNGPPPLTN
jgi:hypothetical protein